MSYVTAQREKELCKATWREPAAIQCNQQIDILLLAMWEMCLLAAEICVSIAGQECMACDCLLCPALPTALTFKGVPFLYFRPWFCCMENLFSAHD